MQITDIESRIKQLLEQGTFQKMCNEILSKMSYTPYSSPGSQIGTNKTIKGTPK